jgi:hypothetical protein
MLLRCAANDASTACREHACSTLNYQFIYFKVKARSHQLYITCNRNKNTKLKDTVVCLSVTRSIGFADRQKKAHKAKQKCERQPPFTCNIKKERLGY